MRSVLLFCLTAATATAQTPKLNLVGDADVLSDRLRLTSALPQQVGAAWVTQKQRVVDGFTVSFRFQITNRGGLGPGADGLAFVLQNQGPDAIAGRGSAGGFALGDGRHDPGSPGIPHSIAVFFDTYQNGEARDPSDNYIAICTNGAIGKMRWPPSRLGMTRKLKVRMKDGRPHEAHIRFDPPLLSVSLDGAPEEVRVPVDLRTVVDESGSAYIGFTASTGNGWENHDLLTWNFQPSVASAITMVRSNITYVRDSCLEGRNLCTPPQAELDELSPGRYHVLLPGHLGVSIPNPGNRAPKISNAQGKICWVSQDSAECAGPEKSLDSHTGEGRTRFSVIAPGGRSVAEGYFEFDVALEP